MEPRTDLITRALEALRKLPADRAEQVVEFADFLLARFEDDQLRSGIRALAMEPGPLDFLRDEEDLYSTDDLKERYR
ncbi:MAG: hypothetical protein IT227_07950 [Flavobacteriales bacterium]|nr:hypothetical protein [Flavobacteriales bacterium]